MPREGWGVPEVVPMVAGDQDPELRCPGWESKGRGGWEAKPLLPGAAATLGELVQALTQEGSSVALLAQPRTSPCASVLHSPGSAASYGRAQEAGRSVTPMLTSLMDTVSAPAWSLADGSPVHQTKHSFPEEMGQEGAYRGDLVMR